MKLSTIEKQLPEGVFKQFEENHNSQVFLAGVEKVTA